MELKVYGSVKHAGKWYSAGDVITGLSTEEYKRLSDMGLGESKLEVVTNNNKTDFFVNGVQVEDPDEYKRLMREYQEKNPGRLVFPKYK
jgi:hypothetical protein